MSAIEELSPSGGIGITPSLLSAWELGRHRTSARYRTALCDLYGEPPEVLFAHQDGRAWDVPLTSVANVAATVGGVSGPPPLRLLTSHRELIEGMAQVLREAQECLVVTGSRSRDVPYLDAIEEALREKPALVHYRVLFGPPHRQVLKDHLAELLKIRDPDDRSLGFKTLHIGVIEDTQRRPERFFCACERSAVIVIPSLNVAEGFDSGVRLEGDEARALVQHAIQVYHASRPVETAEAVSALAVVRSPMVVTR
jgi:hypothetical protein